MILLPFLVPDAATQSPSPFWIVIHLPLGSQGPSELRNKKSKKMRGGVTRKLLTRRKVADLTREIGLGHGGSLNTRIKEFVRPVLTNQSIHQAVRDYLAGGARKKDIVDKYGEINNWDVSNDVTDMGHIFCNATSFNQPINKWNVSKVTDMSWMFRGTSSFIPAAQQLERV